MKEELGKVCKILENKNLKNYNTYKLECQLKKLNLQKKVINFKIKSDF